MSTRRFAGTVFGALLTMAGMSPLARTDEMSELTKVTFRQPVRIPGQVLPAGSYYFTRVDDGNDPDVNLIRIVNSGKKSLDVSLQTITVERERPRGRTVLTFAEDPEGRPPALVDWFYPGSLEGHEFLYAPRRERQIEISEKIIVATNGRGDVPIQNISTDKRR
jgi:hypothetical protein